MGGYNWDKGMSNRAVEAYELDRKPLSKITAAELADEGWEDTLDFAKFLAREGFWPYEEWHHTSKHYNKTKFYTAATLVEEWGEASEHTREMYRGLYSDRKERGKRRLLEDQYVSWEEWETGAGAYGKTKYTLATREFRHCNVVLSGVTARITPPGGEEIVKRTTSRGFFMEPEGERARREHALAERERQEQAVRKHLRAAFRRALKGNRWEMCDYFEWRDRKGRDASRTQWERATHDDLRALFETALDESTSYAERTIARLEARTREVVRLGLHHGIRVKRT